MKYLLFIIIFLVSTFNLFSSNWEIVEFEDNPEFFRVRMYDSLNCVLSCQIGSFTPPKIDNFIMRSKDGGYTWEKIWSNFYPAEGEEESRRVSVCEYLSKDTLLASAEGGLMLRSIDGGDNWDSTFFNRDGATYPLSFFNSKQGLVYMERSDSVFFLTDDAAYSWYPVKLPKFLDGIHNSRFTYWSGNRISDSTLVFLCGGFDSDHSPQRMHFRTIKSLDKGKTWKVCKDSLLYQINFFYFINDRVGFAAGVKSRYEHYPIFLKTYDAGDNWELIWEDKSLKNGFHSSLFALDSLNLVATCTKYFFRSSDGGYTWTKEEIKREGKYRALRNMHAVDDNIIIVNEQACIYIYSPTTGIKEISPTNQELVVYPNPVISGQEVHFKLDREILGNVNFEILDINGNTIDKNTLAAMPENKACSYDTSDLPSGTYFIKITSAKDIWSSKFTIVK